MGEPSFPSHIISVSRIRADNFNNWVRPRWDYLTKYWRKASVINLVNSDAPCLCVYLLFSPVQCVAPASKTSKYQYILILVRNQDEYHRNRALWWKVDGLWPSGHIAPLTDTVSWSCCWELFDNIIIIIINILQFDWLEMEGGEEQLGCDGFHSSLWPGQAGLPPSPRDLL